MRRGKPACWEEEVTVRARDVFPAEGRTGKAAPAPRAGHENRVVWNPEAACLLSPGQTLAFSDHLGQLEGCALQRGCLQRSPEGGSVPGSPSRCLDGSEVHSPRVWPRPVRQGVLGRHPFRCMTARAWCLSHQRTETKGQTFEPEANKPGGNFQQTFPTDHGTEMVSRQHTAHCTGPSCCLG